MEMYLFIFYNIYIFLKIYMYIIIAFTFPITHI